MSLSVLQLSYIHIRVGKQMSLDSWLISYQAPIRGFFFVLFLSALGLLETKYPWRAWPKRRRPRWVKHLGLSIISKIAIRLVFPVVLMQTAFLAAKDNQGVLNRVALPYVFKILVAVLMLDLLIYIQHRMMHRIKWLWYCHRVHHVDKILDVSTGVRFHPLEELISMAFKIFGVVFWGAPVLAVLIFEIVLNLGSLFTHVNIRIPKKADYILRKFIVTPNMHRIHHSDNPQEYNHNFGFCFSLWDRLFSSYQHQPLTGEHNLIFGQEAYQDEKYQTLKAMLLLPFNLKKMKPRRKLRRKLWMSWSE